LLASDRSVPPLRPSPEAKTVPNTDGAARPQPPRWPYCANRATGGRGREVRFAGEPAA
jgi:hypothetical protein